MTRFRRLAAVAAAAGLAGCSILSPVPLVELVKAGGAAAASAVSTGPSHAQDTVSHGHPMLDEVCVEYNPATPDPEIAPALQAEFRAHRVDSRVYAEGTVPVSCAYRLTYTAQVDWGVPPLGDGYAPYLRQATLTLRDAQGRVVASSAYRLDGPLEMGKWSSSRSKLAPVVAAIVNGAQG